MVKRIYSRTILCLLLVIVCLCQNNGHSEPVNSKQRAKVDVGKEDPFSELPRKKSKLPVSRRISDVANIEYTPELFVETITLKFLEAKNLKKAIDSMSSQYGSIATDGTTNSLIICDAMEKLEQIITEIKKADQTPEQIMIEVVILDVQLQDDTEIGIDWEELLGTQADFSLSQDLTSLTTGVTFKAVKKDISGTLRALQEKRSVEILASPRVLVLSGHEAYIKTIEEIPYDEVITSTETGETASGLTNVEFKEVGITLKVKATVTDKNRIMMTIEPDQSIDAGTANTFSSSDVPKVDRRSAKTTLLMEDGQIVIMGGLRKKEKQIITSQVPLFGDLPLIGFLFSNNKEVTKISELIVMISPHIQNGNGLNDKQMEKFNELKNRPMLSLPKDDNIIGFNAIGRED